MSVDRRRAARVHTYHRNVGSGAGEKAFCMFHRSLCAQGIDNLWIHGIGENVLVARGEERGCPSKVGSLHSHVGGLESAQAPDQ